MQSTWSCIHSWRERVLWRWFTPWLTRISEQNASNLWARVALKSFRSKFYTVSWGYCNPMKVSKDRLTSGKVRKPIKSNKLSLLLHFERSIVDYVIFIPSIWASTRVYHPWWFFKDWPGPEIMNPPGWNPPEFRWNSTGGIYDFIPFSAKLITL